MSFHHPVDTLSNLWEFDLNVPVGLQTVYLASAVRDVEGKCHKRRGGNHREETQKKSEDISLWTYL